LDGTRCPARAYMFVNWWFGNLLLSWLSVPTAIEQRQRALEPFCIKRSQDKNTIME